MNRDRQTSNVVVKVVDLAGLEAKALEYMQKQKPNPDLVRMRAGENLGYVQTPKGIYVLSDEGVGCKFMVSEKHPAIVMFSQENKILGGQIALDMVPSLKNSLNKKDVLSLPVKEEVTLDKFIRVFGSRLESNYNDWNDHLSKVVEKELVSA